MALGRLGFTIAIPFAGTVTTAAPSTNAASFTVQRSARIRGIEHRLNAIDGATSCTFELKKGSTAIQSAATEVLSGSKLGVLQAAALDEDPASLLNVKAGDLLKLSVTPTGGTSVSHGVTYVHFDALD